MNSALTLDIPFARKVLEHLLAHPEEHSQSYFGIQQACGTTACIAGTAVLMDPDSTVTWSPITVGQLVSNGKQMTSVQVDGQSMDVEHRAAQLLGLNFFDTSMLFYCFDDVEALERLASYIEEAEAEQAAA